MYRQFNIHRIIQPTQSIDVIYVGLRTNSEYSPTQHVVFGFYIPDESCLLRGQVWINTYSDRGVEKTT